MKRRGGRGGSMRSVVGFLSQRGLEGDPLLTQDFQRRRLRGCRNLYKKDLLGHFGCVNAIEFSNNGGQWLVSGKANAPRPSPPPATPSPESRFLLLLLLLGRPGQPRSGAGRRPPAAQPSLPLRSAPRPPSQPHRRTRGSVSNFPSAAAATSRRMRRGSLSPAPRFSPPAPAARGERV